MDHDPLGADGDRRVVFGSAVVRARVLSRWSGITLIAGMALMAVTAGLPDPIRTASAGVRDAAFAAMGASLLHSQHSNQTTHTTTAEPTERRAVNPVATR